MNHLSEKINDSHQGLLLYELLPPSQDIPDASLEAYIECAIEFLNDCSIKIDAVNIPDIQKDENDPKNHQQGFTVKLKPCVFAHRLKEASHNELEILLNHCTVFEPWMNQKNALKVIKDYDIHHLILVGGNSSKIHYPGPSVLDLSDYIQQEYQNHFFCGGITIQTRRFNDESKDEPFRMITKSQHGIEFFTSQVVYEAQSVKSLLKDYANLCKRKGVSPKRIFLSFAPISTKHDMDFLRWLGVIIPNAVEQELFKADFGIGWRSVKITANILEDILDFIKKENITVPIGLNIEHITRHNFELSQKLLEKLGKLYYHNQ